MWETTNDDVDAAVENLKGQLFERVRVFNLVQLVDFIFFSFRFLI